MTCRYGVSFLKQLPGFAAWQPRSDQEHSASLGWLQACEVSQVVIRYQYHISRSPLCCKEKAPSPVSRTRWEG